jgi:thymidine phosphorylase
MLAPIVAACGGFVPMISGRGLGHTGGTLDKLSAIPGYSVNPALGLFRRTVREVGCAIIGQTDDLAPADRILYAIRDVTATVESVSLITASILSKKLAAGLDGLVMDVKTGSGAFAATMDATRELAESLVHVANGAGLKTTAVITDMDQVLGRNVGNAVEVAEAIAYLTNASGREQRLHAVVMTLTGELLTLGGVTPNVEAGCGRAEAALANGSAAETFARMVAALGGPSNLIDRPSVHLPCAKLTQPCPAEQSGYITGMDTRSLGVAVIELGGGRRRGSDLINPAVGFSEFGAVGSKIAAGEALAIVHADDDALAKAAIATLHRSIRIGDAPPSTTPAVYSRIGYEAGGGSR